MDNSTIIPEEHNKPTEKEKLIAPSKNKVFIDQADLDRIVPPEAKMWNLDVKNAPKRKRVCCWTVLDEGKTFKNMNKAEKKARINQLWGKVRSATMIRSSL